MTPDSSEPAKPDREDHFRKRLLKAARDYLLFTGNPQVRLSEELAGGVVVDLLISLADPSFELSGSSDAG